MTIGSILLYILFGFLIGLVAKIILGYTWRRGFIFLTISGIIGALLGKYIFVQGLKIYLGRWSYLHVGRGIVIHWFWGIVTAAIIILILDRAGGNRNLR